MVKQKGVKIKNKAYFNTGGRGSMKKIIFIAMLIASPLYAATITLMAPSRNVSVSFEGSLIQTNPTACITIGLKKYVMTPYEIMNLRDISNVMYIPGPYGAVNFSISISEE